MTKPWIIVGGGASGLAAAYFLRQHGLSSVVIERDAAIGGRMGTVALGNRRLDCGGKNIGRRYTHFREFAASLGTHPLEPFGLNSSQVIDGRLRTFDGGRRWRGLAALARGASAGDLARFGRLLWSVTRNEDAGYLGSPLARSLARRYDERPASAYFSRTFCDRILRPMTVRMNGAEPDEVHVGTLPSNVRMILDSYDQFTNGLTPLLAAFTAAYEVRLHTATEALCVEHGRVTGVRVRHADGRTAELAAAGVIIATPATTAAVLTEPVRPELARQLRSVAYYPVMLVIAEYEQPVFTPAMRAVVFDGREALSNAGAYGRNELHLVRYTFSGRAFRSAVEAGLDTEALLAQAEAALGRHAALAGNRRRQFVTREFTTGLCAYSAHHAQLLDQVGRERQYVGGLYLTGDYFQGASIEACFRSAATCATDVARHDQQRDRRAPTAA